VDTLSVIAEEKRRRILQLVWDEERSAGEIAAKFDVSFGAISQHLAILRDAGFVEVRRNGRHRLYRANQTALGPLRGILESMWSAKLDQLAAAVEEEQR
jgi:DNA-binding transcriptional ArsR family regulator